MRLNELIDLVIEQPTLIRVPIVSDGYKMMIGYDDEEITMFRKRDEKA